MGFLLYIISSLAKLLIGPFLYIYGSFGAIRKGGTKEWNVWNEDLARAKDQYGNAIGKYYFNDWFGNGFGNVDETISSRLGKNKESNTLKRQGKFWATLLNKLEAEHVEKAIEKDEQ